MRIAAVATAAGFAYVLGWLSRQPQVAAARREASRDGLTDLYNRRELKRQLRNRAKRGKPYVVYLIDLNGFKPVNDTFGHRAGDQLLQSVARRLQAQLAGHFVARLGGDEFVVLTGAPMAGTAVDSLAGRIERAVSYPTAVAGSLEPVTLTAAVGVACGDGTTSYRSVLHQADLAMYRSKGTGRPELSIERFPYAVDESPRLRVRDARPVRVASNR